MKYSEYTFPCKYDRPMEAQKRTVEFLLKNPRAFVLNEMGTGKTLSALWACDLLFMNNKIRSVLVVAPLSTLYSVWVDEIRENFKYHSVGVVHGNKDKRLQVLGQRHNFYLINHDGVRILADSLVGKFDVVIIDELTAFKNFQTERTKSMFKVASSCKAVWGMTGEPTPNEPTEAFGQAKVVNPFNPLLPKFYSRFRDSVMTKINTFVYVPKPGFEKIVRDVLSPGIRFTRDECVDLPPCVFEYRDIEMSKEQKRMFEEMMDMYIAEYKDGQITAANAAVRVGKLLQISAGVVYDEHKNVIELDNKSRLKEIHEIYLQQSSKKLIVYSAFRSSIAQITSYLRSKGIKTEDVVGGQSAVIRGNKFKGFQRGDTNVLVMQPSAASHGITLTASYTIVWASPVPSAETFNQANARITRPGQVNNQLIVMLRGSKAERYVYQALERKQKISDVILKLFE